MVAPLREKLIALCEPLLGQLGFELVDLEYAPGRTQSVSSDSCGITTIRIEKGP